MCAVHQNSILSGTFEMAWFWFLKYKFNNFSFKNCNPYSNKIYSFVCIQMNDFKFSSAFPIQLQHRHQQARELSAW